MVVELRIKKVFIFVIVLCLFVNFCCYSIAENVTKKSIEIFKKKIASCNEISALVRCGEELNIASSKVGEEYIGELLLKSHWMHKQLAMYFIAKHGINRYVKDVGRIAGGTIECDRYNFGQILPIYALYVLSSFDCEEAQEIIRRIVLEKDCHNSLKCYALSLIKYNNTPSVNKLIKRCFGDKDPVLRWAACEYVRKYALRLYSEEVVKCLSDSSSVVRARAIHACATLDNYTPISEYISRSRDIRRIEREAIQEAYRSKQGNIYNIDSKDRLLIYMDARVATRRILSVTPKRRSADDLIKQPICGCDAYVNYIYEQRKRIISDSHFNIIIDAGDLIISWSDTYREPTEDNIVKAFEWVKMNIEKLRPSRSNKHSDYRASLFASSRGMILTQEGKEGLDFNVQDYPDRLLYASEDQPEPTVSPGNWYLEFTYVPIDYEFVCAALCFQTNLDIHNSEDLEKLAISKDLAFYCWLSRGAITYISDFEGDIVCPPYPVKDDVQVHISPFEMLIAKRVRDTVRLKCCR